MHDFTNRAAWTDRERHMQTAIDQHCIGCRIQSGAETIDTAKAAGWVTIVEKCGQTDCPLHAVRMTATRYREIHIIPRTH